MAAPAPSGDDKQTAAMHRPASASAAGTAAGLTAAVRKGKAKLTGHKAGPHNAAILKQDSVAEHHRQQDKQQAALPTSHSTVRAKV